MASPSTYPLERKPNSPANQLPGMENVEAWQMGPVFILKGYEGDGRWHLSMSCEDRLPTWDEIKEARNRLLPPDIFLCLLFPPEKYWMNVHEYCLHLWEIRDEFLLKSMIANAPERSGNIVLP